MSILIKGLEMPTGSECLILTIYPDGQCFEHVYNGSFGSREERKAVPIPPHGRLIDADALLNLEADYEHPLFDSDGSLDVVVPCYDRETIKTAPTVIDAEASGNA